MIRWRRPRDASAARPDYTIPEASWVAPAVSDPAVTALANEARAHYAAQKFAAAEAAIRKAIALAPNDPELWNALGVFQRMAGRPQEALLSYRQALSLFGDHAGAWSNQGNALRDLKYVASAIVSHRRAIALQPGAASFHHNLGLALVAANQHAEALGVFDKAAALEPDDKHIRWDRSLSNLALQNFKRGWADYPARFDLGEIPKRELPGKAWAGGRYRRKRLLILSEQGFGDFIWASRFLKQAKALGGELIVECRPELCALVESMRVADRVIAVGEPLPEADWHCYICSLPGLFVSGPRSIPRESYISAPPDRRARFDFAMKPAGRQLRVGIVWSGSTTSGANSDRALSLDVFVQAFSIPGVQLFSLQKGPPQAQLGKMPHAPVIDLSAQLNDFADTAGAIAQLDLVIMTDSAVGHLAGAMGKPCWMLLNHVPFWLWFTQREDSPWYPSLRLFRSRMWGDWTGPLDAAAVALHRLAVRGVS